MSPKKPELEHLSIEQKRELANLLDTEAYLLQHQVAKASENEVLEWRITERMKQRGPRAELEISVRSGKPRIRLVKK